MDVGRVPGIGGIDVVGTGGGGADEISGRAEQHIVARPRPGIVEEDGVLGPDAGVVEEIEARPAAARGDAEGRERGAEIVRAIGVARDSPGPRNCAVQASPKASCRPTVSRTSSSSGWSSDRRISRRARGPDRCSRSSSGSRSCRSCAPAPSRAGAQRRQEVGALPAGDVDDLDVFAGAHLIGLAVARLTRMS